MAIPIRSSGAEDAEDSYRALDLLLEQLIITLRQVLIHRRREAAANASSPSVRHRHAASEGTAVEEPSEESERPEEATRVSEGAEEAANPGLPLPDVVLDTAAGRARKQSERTRTAEEPETQTSPQTHGWVQVGSDLKRVADQLLTTNRLDQKDDKKAKMKDVKDASLLSLFCPTLGGPVWTTVALLVGWGLLSRTR